MGLLLTAGDTLRYKEGVKRTALRVVVLLWLGWYISGPVAETFDFWDGPRQEVHDILTNASGRLTLFACGFCLILFEARKLRARYSLSRKSAYLRKGAPAVLHIACEPVRLLTPIHSPPTPLRI